MAGPSQTHAQAILNTARGSAMSAWTPYLTFYQGDPDDGGAEVSYTGFTRQAVTFAAPSGLAMSNSVAVTFAAPPSDVTGVTHYAFYDAVSGGTLREAVAFSPAQTLTAGEVPTFDVGNLSMQVAA